MRNPWIVYLFDGTRKEMTLPQLVAKIECEKNTVRYAAAKFPPDTREYSYKYGFYDTTGRMLPA